MVFQSQFETTGLSEDIVAAVALHRKALDICQQLSDQRYLPRSLYLLAGALQACYRRGGSLDDLNESISSLQNALHLLPTVHPNHAQLFYCLAVYLWVRFEKCGLMSDLDEAITVHKKALELRPAPHVDRSASLEALATGLQYRFAQKDSEEAEDLREAILLWQELVTSHPAPHPRHAPSLYEYAVAFQAYLVIHAHIHLQSPSCEDFDTDYEEYNYVLQAALSIHPTPYSNLDRARLLSNHAHLTLLSATHSHYDGRKTEAISKAISFHRKVLNLLPAHHPHRPFTLVRLADALGYQLEQHPSVGVFEEAVLLYDEAMSLANILDSNNNLSPPSPLAVSSNGRLCCSRADLEEEIANCREHLCDLVHETNVHSNFKEGFPAHCSMAELDISVAFRRIELDLRQPPSQYHSLGLNNYAWVLHLRAEQRGTLGDAEEAMLLARKALELEPPGTPDRCYILDTLSAALRSHSRLTKCINGLNEAISLSQDAIALKPFSLHFKNLSAALRLRFERLGSQADLEEAISAEKKGEDAAAEEERQHIQREEEKQGSPGLATAGIEELENLEALGNE